MFHFVACNTQSLMLACLVSGNATDAGQRLLFSAFLGAQAGGKSGVDNIAKSGNDLQQAHALALTIEQSRLTPEEVSSALSQAIAAATESAIMFSIKETEPAALLIETASTVNNSAAVSVVAQRGNTCSCAALLDAAHQHEMML